jgi:hypothetical protein
MGKAVDHNSEENEAGSGKETSTSGRRDANGAGSSSANGSFNGLHNNRGNCRNKGKTEPQSRSNFETRALSLIDFYCHLISLYRSKVISIDQLLGFPNVLEQFLRRTKYVSQCSKRGET